MPRFQLLPVGAFTAVTFASNLLSGQHAMSSGALHGISASLRFAAANVPGSRTGHIGGVAA